MVDALGWRRVLGREPNQPPDAPLSRPRGASGRRRAGPRRLDRSRARPIRLRLERARGRRAARGRRVYEPRDHVRRPTVARGAAGAGPGALPGKLVPASPPARSSGRRVLRGRLGWALLPPLGRRHPDGVLLRHRLRPRAAIGALRGANQGGGTAALRRFSASHSRAFRLALRLQWLVPRLPPRVLTLALRALARQALVDRAFGWYLDRAHPDFVGADRPARDAPSGRTGRGASLAERAGRGRGVPAESRSVRHS